MSISALIRRMSDAGAPPEAIALAVEEIEALQASLDARRVADRDRKRAQREREKSADVTGHSEDCPETVTPRVFLDKEIPPIPPKEIKPFPCVRVAGAKRWHRLPENWQPRALPTPIQSKVDQWPPGTLDDEFAAFRRWAANAEDKNGKGRKLDWDQAWRNWIGRRHDERYSRKPANTNGFGKSAAAFAMLNPGADEPF
jgi:hypothetical protein